MDCESCGRYRPSSEISSLRVAGRLLMACARCRRLATLHRPPSSLDRPATPSVPTVTALVLPR